MKGQELFALAGIWEQWLGADGSEIETMAILTTSANAEISRLHDRMPVVIDRENFDRWLDCRSGTADVIYDLLRPLPDGRLSVIAVNARLNDPRLEGAELQEPAASGLLL